MVVTNRDDLADRIRRLRSHGMTSLTWDRNRGHAASYDVTCHGYNYRLDELRAALGRTQLAKLARNTDRRRRLFERYRRELAGFPSWVVPFANVPGEGAYHLMVAVAVDRDTRECTRQALREAGIQTSLHYPCVPDFTAFAGFGRAELPRSRQFARRAVTLPLYPALTDSQVQEVVSLVTRASGASPRQGNGR